MPKPTTGRTTPSKRPKRPTPRPARGHRDLKPEKGKTVGEGAPRPPEPSRSPAARARDPLTDAEIAVAVESEARGLVCMRALTEGWDLLVPRLTRIWSCTEGALCTYRRLGKVALAAISDVDSAARLDHVLADLRVQANEQEALAKMYRAAGRPTLASRHDDLARKAIDLYGEYAGLKQSRTVVSIEADPRMRGMYQAILAALLDFDRLRTAYLAEGEKLRGAFLAEVESLTGGPLPSSPLLPAIPLPSARAHVVAAVHRYEAEIGARSAAKALPA